MPAPTDFTKRAQTLGLRNIPVVEIGREPTVEVESLGIEVVSDRRVDFTVDRAVDYINLPVFPGEREVTEAHVQFLLGEMEKGRFNWDIVTIARCRMGDRTYKINGQHTSWARIGLADDAAVRVREIHYAAPGEAQLKALYATFDRAKPRTDTHLTRLELVGAAAVAGLWQRTITTGAQGFRFWKFENKEAYKRVGPAELAALIDANASLFQAVGSFLQGLDDDVAGPVVRRQPVVAAMFETFAKVPTVAPSFWRDVAEGTNLVKGDARYALRNYLLTTALQRTGANAAKRIVNGEEMYRIAIAAWNRWRGGDAVTNLRVTARRVKAV